MFRVLDALELDEAAFFAMLAGTRRDPLRCLDRLARGLKKTTQPPFIPFPKIFQQQIDGFLEGQAEASRPKRPQALELPPWPARLQDLDRLRFVAPEAARDRIVFWLPEILQGSTPEAEPNLAPLLPKALGVAASIERVAGRARHAAHYLRIALRLETEHWSPRYGDLLVRACHQLGDQADYETAFDIAQQAMDIYLQAGDLHGVGQALVHRAVMAFKMKTPPLALNLYRAALHYLSDMDWQNRFAALQGSGMVHFSLGQVAEAERYAELAAKTHRTQSGLNWWRLVWLQAEIAYQQHDLDRSNQLFSQTQEAFEARGNTLDSALLFLKRARVSVAGGKLQESQQLAAQSMVLLRPLRFRPRAHAVMNDFARCALMGELTLQRIEHLCARLESPSSKGWDAMHP